MDIKKFLKVVWNLCNKQKYSVHIRTLKQALNHGLTLKQVRRIIGFNQKMQLKPCIGVNAKVRTETEN